MATSGWTVPNQAACHGTETLDVQPVAGAMLRAIGAAAHAAGWVAPRGAVRRASAAGAEGGFAPVRGPGEGGRAEAARPSARRPLKGRPGRHGGRGFSRTEPAGCAGLR